MLSKKYPKNDLGSFNAIGLRNILITQLKIKLKNLDEYKTIARDRVKNEIQYLLEWQRSFILKNSLVKESKLHPKYSKILFGHTIGMTLEELVKDYKATNNKNHKKVLLILSNTDKTLLKTKGIKVPTKVEEYVNQELNLNQ